MSLTEGFYQTNAFHRVLLTDLEDAFDFSPSKIGLANFLLRRMHQMPPSSTGDHHSRLALAETLLTYLSDV